MCHLWERGPRLVNPRLVNDPYEARPRQTRRDPQLELDI